MNRNIQNIINKYNTYSKDSLIKLINKNNHIKREIKYKDNLLKKTSLFDILLKAISIGYGGFWVTCSTNIYKNIKEEYNKCKYKNLYKISQELNRIYISIDNELECIDLNSLIIVNIQNF